MTKKRKAFRAILAGVILIEIGISYRQVKNLDKQANQIKGEIDEIDKEAGILRKEAEQILTEINSRFRHSGHLAMPTNGVNTTLHDSYEDALIQDIDDKRGLVLVTIIDSKTNIVFKPTADNLGKFRKGYIAPVTFQCTKKIKNNCDFNSPYKLFVRNSLVEMKELRFPKK